MFNLALAVAALPFVGLLTSVLARLMPDKTAEENPLAAVSALDPNALGRPQRGLDCAARELLGMGQKIEHMLISVEPLYDTWNSAAAKTIRDQDAVIKTMHLDVKLYLARLGQSGLDQKFLPPFDGACIDFIQPGFRVRCCRADHVGTGPTA